MSFEPLRQRARTLRFRLMLWNALAVVITGLAILASVRLGVRLTLIQEIDEVLADDSQEIALQFNDSKLDAAATNNQWHVLQEELNRKARGHKSHGWFVQLLTKKGAVYWSSENAPDQLPLDNRLGQSQMGTKGVFRYRHNTLPPNPSPAQYVNVGCTQSFISRDMARIDRLVLLVGSVVLLIAPLGGYLLAGRATKPLAEMIQTTQGLHPEKLEERVKVRGSGDELDSLARTINDLLDRLAAYLRQRHDFLANAAHELRTPLAAIRSSVEVALGGARSKEEYEELLGVVIDQCSSLESLVNQLLLLAETEADRLKSYAERFSLDKLVKAAVDMFQGVCEFREIKLTAGDCPTIAIAGNRQHLRQVLNNLLDNAIKFTALRYSEKPGGEIYVELQKNEALGVAVLTIQDNGVGIAQEHLKHLFERFFRVDKSRSRDKTAGGTGLGLSICQAIVVAHNGKIEIASQLNQGTTFTITLPLAPAMHS